MTSFWAKQIVKADNKACYRTIQLARTNPDYIAKHPQEHKQNPNNKILTTPHPEAVKRCLHDLHQRTHNSFMPAVTRPQRYNRVG